jgi:hypothetical protein
MYCISLLHGKKKEEERGKEGAVKAGGWGRGGMTRCDSKEKVWASSNTIFSLRYHTTVSVDSTPSVYKNGWYRGPSVQ